MSFPIAPDEFRARHAALALADEAGLADVQGLCCRLGQKPGVAYLTPQGVWLIEELTAHSPIHRKHKLEFHPRARVTGAEIHIVARPTDGLALVDRIAQRRLSLTIEGVEGELQISGSENADYCRSDEQRQTMLNTLLAIPQLLAEARVPLSIEAE